MGNRAFAPAAICGSLLTLSLGASAQGGPATTQAAPTALPALPPPPEPAAAPPAATAPAVAWESPSSIELRLEGRRLRVKVGTSEAAVDLGCTGRTTLQQGDRAFVACGADGVVEVDLSNPLAPRRAGTMAVDGEATALFARGGRVWVEIARFSAKPVRTGVVVDLPSPPASPPPAEVGPSLLAPPRRGGLWELSAEAGAFVNLGPSSGGALAWGTAVYRFDVPVVVRLELSPLAFAAGRSVTTILNTTGSVAPAGSDSISLGAVQGLVGFDTQFVEVAVGGGAATLGNTSGSGLATGGGSIATEARFGARDGLAVTLESIVVGANEQFRLASLVTTLQVPLTASVMLVARGGGGNVGILFGDLGARVLVAGDGGRGTIALAGFFGGEGIDFQGCASSFGAPSPGLAETCPYASLGGPSIGGGVEWRP